MYITDIIRRSGRNLRQAKARTVLTSLAIGVGAFALTLTLAASNGARTFVNGVISENFDPAELIVAKDDSLFSGVDSSTPQEYDDSFGDGLSDAGAAVQIKRLDENDITVIENIEGVENVRLEIVINLTYLVGPNNKKYVGTIQAENPFQKLELIAGSRPNPLRNKQILLPEDFLDALGFKDAADAIGKNITIAVTKNPDIKAALQDLQAGNKSVDDLLESSSSNPIVENDFTIIGVMKKPSTPQPGTELYLYAGEQDVKNLQEINTQGTDNFRKYPNAYARIKGGENDQKIQAAQERIKQAGYASFSVEDTQKFLNQAINVLQGIVVTFSLIAVVASLFGVINTMYISVLQRTREIGLMKALGMRKRDVSRLFRFEAAWIGFLGGTIGSALAILLGKLLNPTISEKLSLAPGKELLEFRFLQIAVLILGLMFVAVVAGLFPARKASKLDPIEALRNE